MSIKILVTIPFTDSQKEKIRVAAGDNTVIFKPMKEVTEADMPELDVVMGNVAPALLKKAPHLKWLQLNSAGANVYCPPEALAEEVALTCSSGAYDISVSENMVAYTLAMLKRMPEYHENQKQHLWNDQGPAGSAHGANVVVFGTGNIGQAYAKIMKAMGSYTIGIKKNPGKAPEGFDEVHTLEEKHEYLKKADIVALVLPGTPETVDMIGEAELAEMKETACIINVGRGNAINPAALNKALKEGTIAGAAIDVTEPEPLPADDVLWDAPNLIITPHIAGKYHIPITLEIISDICAENLKHFLAGEPLEHTVNRKAGY